MRNNIFDIAAETGKAIDFHDIMYKFTLDSFILYVWLISSEPQQRATIKSTNKPNIRYSCRLGFGVDLGALKQEEKTPFAASFDAAQAKVFERLLIPGWRARELLTAVFLPWKTSMSYHVNVVDKFARKIVQDRLAEAQKPEYVEKGDLLSRFIQTTNAEDQSLNETELRDIIVNFIIAGRDTTSQALSWTFFELMMHPQVENKLLKEVLHHITDDIEDDPLALYEAIKEMKYAHAV